MANKFNIQDDAFIPEGLEFREEYLEQGMSMYKAIKRRIFWKKFLITSTLVVGVVTGGIWFFVNDHNGQIVEVNVRQQIDVADEQMVVTDEQKGTSVVDSHHNGEVVDASDSTKATPNEIKETSKNNIEEYRLSNVNLNENIVQINKSQGKLDQSGMTEDHGNSTSSGVGLPDLTSNVDSQVKKDLIDNQDFHLETKASKVDVSPLELLIDSKTDIGTVPTSRAATPSGINSLPGIFQNEIRTLQKSDVIPVLKWQRWIPYLQVGMNAWSDYGSNTRKIKPDPSVVIGVDYKLHNAFTLSAGARYFNVTGTSHPFEVKNTSYNQGFTTVTQTYYTDRLYYGGLQFSIRKSVKGNHEVALGYGLDYLLGANNRIAETTQSSFENKELGTTKANGFTEGFSSINHSLSFGYQYWLGKNKAMGFTYHFGLTDITGNKFFTQNIKDRNSMLTVYFRMNLTR